MIRLKNFLALAIAFASVFVFGFVYVFACAAESKETTGSKRTKKSNKSWVFVQTSQLYGPITMTVTPTALKAVARDFSVLACAPTWKVCVFNARKQMYEEPMSRWADTGLQPLWGPKSSKDKYDINNSQITKTCKICDLACKCIELKPRTYGAERMPSLSKFANNMKNSTWSSIEICVTQEIQPVPQLAPFLRGLRKTAEWTNAVVLRSTHTYTSGKKMLELDTLSCKQMTVPSSELQYPSPKTHKLTKGIEEVIQTQTARESMEDIFKSVIGK